MLSNQILQKTIYEMGDILECNCSIWNMEGEMLAAVGNEKLHIKKSVDSFIKEHSEEKYQLLYRLVVTYSGSQVASMPSALSVCSS